MDRTGTPTATADPNRRPPSAPGSDPFSRQLLAAMLAFRNGDFAARMPADFTGIEGKIADTFNEIATLGERRALETARVSRTVGREGKLKQRMAVPGVVGGWADEVAAVNTLIDDLVRPTTEVTRAIAAVKEAGLVAPSRLVRPGLVGARAR